MDPFAHAPESLMEWLGEAMGDPVRLGGKAASLDRLMRMGFLVPPGFCLTTDALMAQLVQPDLVEQVRAAVAALPDETARRALERLVTEAPMQPSVAGVLEAALTRLFAGAATGVGLLAVRSSAVGEDGASSSFAGQHETELGVTAGEVGAAVRRCWASLWSERAIAYRRRRGLPHDELGMAVVVQVLVPATAAAVVFTRHPVTGRDDQLLVNAARGLGEAIASGTVTPDTVVLDKADLAVRELHLGDGRAAGPALSESQLRELAELCLDVEGRFGEPVDVEVALAGERWYLLQARPITTA